MINFVLCAIGWEWYDKYIAGAATWREYLAHRRKCDVCTKPKKGNK